MTKVFLDSDILIDLLAKRDHYQEAAALFAILEEGKMTALTSPVVLANVYYIVAKFSTPARSRKVVKILRKKIRILPMNERIVDRALESDFTDFEDALQYYTAEHGGADFIVTRNKKDYAQGRLTIVTAQEYLDLHQAWEGRK